jgi:hypothetical protein
MTGLDDPLIQQNLTEMLRKIMSEDSCTWYLGGLEVDCASRKKYKRQICHGGGLAKTVPECMQFVCPIGVQSIL